MSTSPINNPLGYQGVQSSNPPAIWYRPRDPTYLDVKNYEIGDLWQNTVSLKFWILASVALGQAVWKAVTDVSNIVISTINDIPPDGTGNFTISSNSNMGIVSATNGIVLNPYTTADITVDPTAGQGTYTTISAALTAASSGQTIFVRPGTYTENLTLKAGVNICAFICDAYTPNVTVIGKCSFSSAGTVNISGIYFQTNSDYICQVSGSAASVVGFTECYFNLSNHVGFNLSSSSASAELSLYSCGYTGVATAPLFSISGSGTLALWFLNSQGTPTTTNCAISGSATADIHWSSIGSGITTSGSGSFYATWSNFLPGIDANAFVFGGSVASMNYCNIFGQMVVNSSANICYCYTASNQTDTITGSGTFTGAANILSGTKIINTSTVDTLTIGPPINVPSGGTGTGTFTAYSTIVAGTTSTGNFQDSGAPGASGTVWTSNGSSALPTWQANTASARVNVKTFTTSDTYRPTTGMSYCTIECTGSGAGAGGTANAGTNLYAVGGGGGGGCYSRKTVSAATIGTSQTVTVGVGGTGGAAGNHSGTDGGTSSVGSICTAPGGSHGVGNDGSTTIDYGGAGGVAGTGDFTVPGGAGGGCYTPVPSFQGEGGSSVFGFGGTPVITTPTNGANGSNYGGGGAGGNSYGNGTSAGGNGAGGLVVITEYF